MISIHHRKIKPDLSLSIFGSAHPLCYLSLPSRHPTDNTKNETPLPPSSCTIVGVGRRHLNVQLWVDLCPASNWSRDDTAVYYRRFIKDRFANCKLITVLGVALNWRRRRRPASSADNDDLLEELWGRSHFVPRLQPFLIIAESIRRDRAPANRRNLCLRRCWRQRQRRRSVPVTSGPNAFYIDDKNAVWKLIGYPTLEAPSSITELLLGNINGDWGAV